MILLIEMQCKDWEHDRVNAGITRLCHAAFPDEQLKLYGERKHIEELGKLVSRHEIKLAASAIDFYDWRYDSINCAGKYEKLLLNILDKEPEAERILLLSCNHGIVMAAANVCRIRTERKIYIITHSIMEEVCININFGQYIKQRLLAPHKITMRHCINKCTATNCSFFIYAPCYERELRGKIKRSVLEKFTFLHHPLYEPETEKPCVASEKIIIGIYGQAVNQNAYEIIDYYNRNYDNGHVVFKIMAKENNDILKLKNTLRLFEKDYVKNDELEYAIRGFDYVLIPYSDEQYRVSASGIFCDAVSLNVPVLMLDSPLFMYYSRYNMGIQESSITAMAYRISQLYMEDITKYQKSEQVFKHIVEEENVEKFTAVMS